MIGDDPRNKIILQVLYRNNAPMYFNALFKEVSTHERCKNRPKIHELLNKLIEGKDFVAKEKIGKKMFYRLTDKGKIKCLDLSFDASSLDQLLDDIKTISRDIGNDPNYSDKINDLMVIIQDLENSRDALKKCSKIVTKRFSDSVHVG